LAKRILIYTNHFYPEQFKINEIVDWLTSEDSHIRVITGLPNYPSGKIIKEYSDTFSKNILINRLFLIPRGRGSNFLLIINYLSYFISCLLFTLYIAIFKKKYDKIFVHHTSPPLIMFHPILYSVFHKSTKILWDLDIWPESLKAIGVVKSQFSLGLIELIVKWIYSKYKFILVSSKSMIGVIRDRYNGEIIYFPNWAEKVIEQNKIIKNYSLTIDENNFNIIYTGNIGKAQNFNNLIKTIESVNKNIHWIFVGSGRYKKDFIEKLQNKNLIDRVTFLGQVKIDEIPTIVNKGSALFLSLRKDEIFSKTVPAKLQTYMALGKPIIGALNGEGAKIIIESNCGVVEENYDYLELAKKINNFANISDSQLATLGKNGKTFYQKNFNSKLRMQQIQNLIYG
tara:strand:- start:1730 stop:2923 length:1194 start_codon:yes stop_codon:yes gene_type:complete